MENNLNFWKRVSKLYTPLQEKANRSVYPTIINACLPYMNEEDVALELACGTGQFSFAFAKHIHHYIASDFCLEMIQEAKKRQTTTAIFQVVDATDIPYEDETFDVVMIANALHIMPDVTSCLHEIQRVLKKDGYAFFITFVYEGKIPTMKLKLLEKAGFKTYHKWNDQEYRQFIQNEGFEIVDHVLFQASPLPEALLIVKKNHAFMV